MSKVTAFGRDVSHFATPIVGTNHVPRLVAKNADGFTNPDLNPQKSPSRKLTGLASDNRTGELPAHLRFRGNTSK